MITVVNNPLSFLQFAKGNTAPDCGTPLLFNDNGDLKFHVVLQGPEIETALSVPLKLYLLPLDFVPTDLPSIQAAAVAKHVSGFAVEQLSSTKAVFYQINKLYDDTDVFDLPDEGECFRIAIALDSTIDGEKPYWLSNCILRSPANDEFSSVLEYSCEENSFGFFYCNADISNIVRIYMYLYQPQYEDDEDIYFRSDGSADILKSVTRAIYLGKTDYADKDMHKRIKVALSHDFIYIKSDEYTGGIRKNGAYDIDWSKDTTIKEAIANFKVYETPFLVRNDNCAECLPAFGDCPALVNVQTELADNGNGTQTITFTWDNTNLDLLTMIRISYKITGSADPYVDNDGDKISPRSVILPLGKYDFILTSVGDGSEESCETSSSDVIPNIGIVPEECVPASQTNIDFALPDGAVGIPYNASMALTGTGPFELSSVVKPGWMTIEPSGNNIVFTGTPGPADDGTAIAVSFDIENCEDSVLPFADTIDIMPSPTLIQTSNTTTGPGGIRTQIFQVGADVNAGNKFYVEVYSHHVEVIAVGGDTPTTIATKLKNAVNATTAAQWNDHGSAPSPGTAGFKPAATSAGDLITITLDNGHQFAPGATIS